MAEDEAERVEEESVAELKRGGCECSCTRCALVEAAVVVVDRSNSKAEEAGGDGGSGGGGCFVYGC